MRKRPHHHLIAWERAHQLCLKIYQVTGELPSYEKFGLSSQMRRSAYSIPMNIAEGNSRRSYKDKAHFFEISISSLEELHYQCELAMDLHYIPQEIFGQIDTLINTVGFLISKLRKAFVK